ncbi:MAG TPA: dihydropteroate synthase [Bacteroidota bacterium]|nr:dihydropteroate synthase [Bacteroidota bacterium]
MGILNVTPDSFSDGGKYFDVEQAVSRGMQLARDGADILDVGGESTRPGSDPVPEEEEIRRVVPVIKRLSRDLDLPISVDTYKSGVAKEALAAGACIVNDISGLTYDASMVQVVRSHDATIVLMHVLGTPKTMQSNPQYHDVVREVFAFLKRQSAVASAYGVGQIIVDPGLGFGKELHHNLELMKQLQKFCELGFPVLVGPSRKSFIGKLLDLPVDQRIEGTAAAVTACILRGAHIVRVHDVKDMKRVAVVADALKRTEMSA